MTLSFQIAKTDPKAKASVFTCVIAFMSSILVSGEKTTLKFNIALKRYTSEEKDYRWHRRPRLWDAFSLRRMQETDVYLPPISKLDFLKR